MDSTSMVSRQPLPLSSTGFHRSSSKELRISPKSVVAGGRSTRLKFKILASGFDDPGHLQYYESKTCATALGKINVNQEKTTRNSSPKKMKKKKQLKLLKGLSRDLSTFYQMGFGLDFDGALVDHVKANTISEAAEVLLQQVQKIRSEEKRKRKEEKANLKASQKQSKPTDCEVSSCSSSESSDSECGEVIQMNSLRQGQTVLQQPPTLTPPPSNIVGEKGGFTSTTTALVNSPKIEVCMGGKCKKSGAATLLDEFQRAVGIEGAVSGCKCMGKCREGPNVKVLSGCDTDGGVPNVVGALGSLCIGVGLEDVKMIVDKFIGGNHDQLGFALS